MSPSIVSRTFSMVELTTALAVTVVLAAIAIPAVARHALQARAIEARLVHDGVWATFRGMDDDACVTPDGWSWNPWPYTIGKQARPWNGDDASWNAIGFAPDGDVRCSYWPLVDHGTCTTASTGEKMRLAILCNLDGDTTWFKVDSCDGRGCEYVGPRFYWVCGAANTHLDAGGTQTLGSPAWSATDPGCY